MTEKHVPDENYVRWLELQLCFVRDNVPEEFKKDTDPRIHFFQCVDRMATEIEFLRTSRAAALAAIRKLQTQTDKLAADLKEARADLRKAKAKVKA